ncbi:formyltetrahydrofolate deformylase [Jeotgalibacillus proteolyticus]|uniref:Formyltetrahydrofolate deformylase n=1 Tax=Jeotgalibacillus proteolyticus TaxID=2082395 RepID=A0A2S5GAI7_9BACL|nr:formyltetrahydrofolate deformylase [Jeotgalibacillus proteolyticus]PPA69935.1 formyltetrahydrofolate deformylase [Jeotgalibacillus proteolyticus]
MTREIEKQLSAHQEQYKNRGILLVRCPDQPGIIAAVSRFLFQYSANIIDSSQYSTNPEGGDFFIRIEFACEDLQQKKEEIKTSFKAIAENFSMDWKMNFPSEVKRTAIFASKELHCLRELLFEWQSGDLITDIAVVVSNHETARELVEGFGIPFVHIQASKENRSEAEAAQLKILQDYEIDVIVLARYMQILTPAFVEAHPKQIINIHHSFLPAFVGARPYDRAYQRGVKLIGATAHYVTNDLDEGPIIEQDIERVNHRDNIENMKKIGRSIERRVLARAVKWHLEDRIIVDGNKTIVF